MICSLEIFHAVILKWAPKRVHFSYNGMRARVQSACLSHNANIGRAHAKTKEGVRRYRLEYTKSTKWPRSCTTMSCNFLKDLLNDVHTTILGIHNGTGTTPCSRTQYSLVPLYLSTLPDCSCSCIGAKHAPTRKHKYCPSQE